MTEEAHEIAQSDEVHNGGQSEGQLASKRSRKRQLKKEKWLEQRPIKRAKEKERLKLRRKEAKLNNVDLGLSRKAMKNYKMSSSSCKIRVCLDFSFDHLMGDKELNKCVNQMGRCYSANRRTKNPLQFYVTNFKGTSKDKAQKHDGYSNWDAHSLVSQIREVTNGLEEVDKTKKVMILCDRVVFRSQVYFEEQHYSELFRKEELVYLSSESENVITELKEEEVYVIGALVDHNSQKGLCLRIAEEKGLKHGRLPIDEFVQLKTRKVLTIDQVFSILANVACCGMNWKDAFLRIIPHRKGVKDKEGNSEIEDDTFEAENESDESDQTKNTADVKSCSALIKPS